jgi:hypothetical protein
MENTMTKDEILNMPAGREMDALIAEKLMGYVNGRKCYRYADNSGDWWTTHIPHYSTDIEAAWEVLEKMRADCSGGGEPDYIMLNCYKELEPHWYCAKIWAHHDGDIPEVEATAETAPLAICRAALLAICGK